MRLGVLLFEDFELLDVFGPLEMFGQIDELDIQLFSKNKGPVRSAQGPEAHARMSFLESEPCQIILIPGGGGTRKAIDDPEIIEWVARAASTAKFVTSVCTGSALLAKAGVLNGKRATTNKLAYSWVTSNGAETEWVAKARWIQDGHIFTSAGVSAGIDMSLAVIKEIYGEDQACKVADWAEYTWNQDSTSDVFSARYGLV